MSDTLDSFHEELFQEIARDADADGRWAEDAFFTRFCDYLVEAGELDTHDRARYAATGMRIDGYGGDPAIADGTLTLIVAEFIQSTAVETLTATAMDAIFNRATAFLEKSLQSPFRDKLDETTAGHGLASMIADSWGGVSRVRILLITNKVLSTRVDGRDSGEVDGRPVGYTVWDLGRLEGYVRSGKSREEMIVDLTDHGAPVPALRAHLKGVDYEAYLLVIPGSQLASIYYRWGARLLEQNVRVFLQAKGNVNKGIRNTLENDGEMFFAYNNGITATAEAVTCRAEKSSLVVASIKNLQIVNGGQTAASIFAVSRKKDVDLSRVFVQMKLSVISPARAEEVVPKISEYANSQNKVSAADFFSNHPFHLRLKDLSGKIFAPSSDGIFRQSKWFYERARGQYQDARGKLTPALLKKFDLEFPKTQLITKTDLAKYLATWDGLPHTVSKGAQKNFADFASKIGSAWKDKPDCFNESYFRDVVSKAILFRATERLVSARPWYDGGYRANIVAYAIAKLVRDLSREGRGINLDLVWSAQQIPTALADALVVAADAVRTVIVNPISSATTNVTEWAKKELCWKRVEELAVDWPASLETVLVGYEELWQRASDAVKQQKEDNKINAQIEVVKAGHSVWNQVRDWAIQHGMLSMKERDVLAIASDTSGKLPTDRQSIVIMSALEKLKKAGCPFGPK